MPTVIMIDWFLGKLWRNDQRAIRCNSVAETRVQSSQQVHERAGLVVRRRCPGMPAVQHGIHHEGKAVSDCDGESKNTDSEEGMRPQPLHPGRDGAGFRRACSHSRGVFSLAHDEHKAAHQHAGDDRERSQ